MSRDQRVAELIKQVVSDVIQRDIGPSQLGLISITDVVVSKDLRSAKVYFSFFKSTLSDRESVNVLNKHKKYIAGELRRQIMIKSIPQLRFFSDDSLERGSAVLHKLKEIESAP